MADPIDLDEIMAVLNRGYWPERDVIMAMRNELCAWRAAHHGGAVVVTDMRASQPPVVIAAVKAYRACIERVLAELGYPQTGDTGSHPTTVDHG